MYHIINNNNITLYSLYVHGIGGYNKRLPKHHLKKIFKLWKKSLTSVVINKIYIYQYMCANNINIQYIYIV